MWYFDSRALNLGQFMHSCIHSLTHSLTSTSNPCVQITGPDSCFPGVVLPIWLQLLDNASRVSPLEFKSKKRIKLSLIFSFVALFPLSSPLPFPYPGVTSPVNSSIVKVMLLTYKLKEERKSVFTEKRMSQLPAE